MATTGAPDPRGHGDRGFTLIELLIVMTVTAILAGIAIPVFMNQRTKGHQASVMSALKNAGTVATAFAAGSSGSFAGLHGDDGTILTATGFRTPTGVLVAVSSSTEAYCVLATHSSLPDDHAWAVATIDIAIGAPRDSDTCVSVPTPAVPAPAPDPEPSEAPSAEPSAEPTQAPSASPSPSPSTSSLLGIPLPPCKFPFLVPPLCA